MQSFSPAINTKRFNKFEKWSSQLIYLKFDLNFQSKLEDLDDFKNPKIEHVVSFYQTVKTHFEFSFTICLKMQLIIWSWPKSVYLVDHIRENLENQ
jgi:hypothetical protein